MIRQLLERYISLNYEKLLKSARYITQDDTAEDLLHDVLMYLLTREEYTDKMKNVTPNPYSKDQTPNYYNYIVRCLAIQHFSNTTEYAKTYRNFNEPITDDLEGLIDFEYETTYEDIISFVSKSKLFKTKIKNLWTKEIFIDYFNPETKFNLSGITNIEVNVIRKTSFRKVAKKYNISNSSVRNAIDEIVNKLRQKYG